MKWKAAATAALKRYCRRHDSRLVSLHVLVQEELDQIRRDTQSCGKTPDATLRRELQELAAMGLIEFVDNRGTYKYLGDI